MRSSKPSKVTKASSNQSTLASFFNLSSGPQQKIVSNRLTKSLNDKIDLTSSSDESEILRDISNKKSQLSQVSSTDSFADTADEFTEEVQVKNNLKSKRRIGLEKENTRRLDYNRTDITLQPIVVSISDDESKTSAILTKKQRTLPWANNNIINKNPRLANKSPVVRQESRSKSSFNLSDEQQQVLKYILEDKLNVFYTGSAGTGKSVLLKQIIKKLYKRYSPQAVAVTASTGLAAVNIGGQTINRFAGIGIGKESVEALVSKIKKSRVSEKWKKIKVLIIDEVSMIDGNLFWKLNQIAKLIRSSDKPFGGIQVIVTGDFFQLPPVPDRNGPRPIFCFQSPAWQEVIQRTILLTQVFRQKGDTQLIDMLNSLRIGAVDDKIIQQFRSLQRPVTYEDGLEPTELFPLRHEVDRANKIRLDKLSSQVHIFRAMDSGTQQFLNMLDNVMAVKELHLKEDAQVMMLKNKNEFLVNGSVGRVLYFVTPALWEQINKTYRSDIDLPDIINEVRILTRCIDISYFPPDLEKEIALVQTPRFDKLVQLATREKLSDLFPVVKFSSIDGMSEIEHVTPDDFSIDVKGGSVTRTQLPLVLSWALSIHKSQGQTLERVKVDLNKVFENGQVYVALSRAVSKEALQIVGFNPAKIRCSDAVKAFYNSLQRFQ